MTRLPVTLKQIVAEFDAAMREAERYECDDAPTPDVQERELGAWDAERAEHEGLKLERARAEDARHDEERDGSRVAPLRRGDW